ncbi:MAG: LysR family transcriptional regulator [Pseudomonadota bacterium]
MKLTLHQLRIFRIVAEEGSIAGAARRLHLTPPTLSIQLRQLNEAARLPLYEIIGRKLKLTGIGQDMLEAARAIDQQLRLLDQRLAARRGIERGRLRIAAVSTAEYFVPGLLGEFRRQHPGIEASLQIMRRDALLHRMEQGLDDGYLMTRPPQAKNLQQQQIGINPLVMIAAPDHPWHKQTDIDFKRLNQQRFVVREPGSGTRLWTAEWLARFGHQLHPELELGSNEAIKQAVKHGHGLAVISLHAVQLELAAGELVLLPVPHFPAPIYWHFIHATASQPSPAARAFHNHLNEHMPNRDKTMIKLLLKNDLSWPNDSLSPSTPRG